MQNVPTPEKEFAEYTFKHKIDINKVDIPTVEMETIAMQITALMNTSGGLILLYHVYSEKDAYDDNRRDNWMQDFEKRLLDYIPESLIRPVVRYRYLWPETCDEFRIYIFISRSRLLATFKFHARSRLGASVRKVHVNDFPSVQGWLHDSHSATSGVGCESQIKSTLEKGSDFQVGDKIRDSESEIMEFKHCYVDQTKQTEAIIFGDNIRAATEKRLDRYIKTLCAFANTQGGSLVVGVKEGGKFPVVRGFPVSPSQEDVEGELTDCFEEKLNQCIWHGDPDYKSVRGKDWDVHYHEVVDKNDVTNRRKMIEVCISKHSGGMFLRPPVFYDVPEIWKGEISKTEDFNLWKKRFLDSTGSHSERRDMPRNLERHEGNRIAIPERHEQEQLAVQQQPVTVTGEVSAEVKTLKSFNESQSKYNADIEVHGIRKHDCCTEDMTERLKTFTGDIWYPSIEKVRERLPRDACSDNLISFLEKKEWHGLVSVIEIERKCDTIKVPDGYSEMCHMLKISREEAPLLMCCITCEDQREIDKNDKKRLVTYALDSGRVLKRGFVMSTANQQYSCMFHFDIEVLRVSVEEGVTPKSVWNSDEVQPVLYPKGNQEEQYTVACNGLSEYLLRKKDFVQSRYGDILTAHLTKEQAKIVNGIPKRVLIVNGRSGTGKTVIALDLARKELAAEALAAEEAEAGKKERNRQHVLYICSNEGLKSFVKHQLSRKYRDGEDGECESRPHFYVIALKSTGVFSPPAVKLENVRLIIVDDVHAIQLDKNWESNTADLYRMLFKHAAMNKTRVAIFFDPEQDYKEHLPAEFDKKLRHLAETNDFSALKNQIEIHTLEERIRNSQTINCFMQANQNQAKIDGTIKCLNERQGDDIILDYIGNNKQESANIVNAKLNGLGGKYDARSVAILCDDDEQMIQMKQILEVQFNRRFQDTNTYPIEHTVICSIEDFGGQEAEVILFILPRRFTDIKENWKYVNIISSRAIERLEFLLPLKSDETEEEKQKILADLRELFKIVSSDFSLTPQLHYTHP